ncbi:unnamed protein product [Prunus armeniaca]|uniref:Retrovirus-related Pol polyprotein from transposon TNT 1-94-like beta-barrel domain-containing protein n=1 Tax=Prunus armeniaca TaxID=36596 RepID=A0A6J5VM81_PRUAR|nr:unnamed protein product [Prunus armeniaca]CAB4319590.1 unnamed protein product [Prunus armeniaca]
MAYVDGIQAGRDHLWFLDSGCSNHMCGKRELFLQFDNNFREKVKLGNDMSLTVITEVFFVPALTNNLLSIGQLQEKGLTVLMQHRKCKIYHPEKGLIMETEMACNRMFTVLGRIHKKTSN